MRHTSSPTPESEGVSAVGTACTSMARLRHWIHPRLTGRSGFPSTKHPMMSVPPEIDWTGTGPTCSRIQSYCQSCRIEPVERTVRRS